jgi:glycine cleavage system H lipoate-binding protein
MRCPFLREANVRYCRAAPLKKMIVHRPGQVGNERCSSPEYERCPLAREQMLEPNQERCPLLDSCLVQYCAAASVTKYIPYSESGLSRCTTDGHRYCDLYLAVANAGASGEPQSQPHGCAEADALSLPRMLRYSPNHLWLDMSPEGVVHIGIDAFMAAIIQEVSRVEFIETRGRCRPTVILSICEADLPLTFPNPVNVVRCNSSLRSAPERLTAHPYGSGWLFEGISGASEEPGEEPPEARNLICGQQAHSWIHEELGRLTEVLQGFEGISAHDAPALLADGGTPYHAHLRSLGRSARLRLFHEFSRLP